MSPSEKQKQIDSEKEKGQFLEREKEREQKAREQRLLEHREQLRQQMFLRSDYYQLSFITKFFIFTLVFLLVFFSLILALSYSESLKPLIFSFIKLII
ncbi:MAG: hypothetical protein VXV96_00535 [Bdellovibrionota bacterium]|nr:hypothetical protein [Bdellovibrionota bacterium]